MILRRIARAVRRQDWFVVAIELLIVAVGIFLGLEATEWNEGRKAREREAVYLERLRDDVAAMLEALREHAAQTDERRRMMVTALRALEDCETGPEARAAVEFAFANYQVSPAVGYLGATYDEMVSTGAFARLADVDLKQAIADAFSYLGDLQQRIANIRTSMDVVDQIAWSNVTFSLDTDARPTVDFDVAELCRKREVRNALVEMIDIQWDSLSIDRAAMARAERFLGMMAARGGSAP